MGYTLRHIATTAVMHTCVLLQKILDTVMLALLLSSTSLSAITDLMTQDLQNLKYKV